MWDRYAGLFGLERAAALTNLGLLHGLRHRYGEAEALHRRALDACRGRDAAVEAAVLHNIANLYGVQGRFAEAEPLYERSLALREAALGPDHPVIAALLADYAAALRRAGRVRQASELEKRLERMVAGNRRDNLLGHTIDASGLIQ